MKLKKKTVENKLNTSPDSNCQNNSQVKVVKSPHFFEYSPVAQFVLLKMIYWETFREETFLEEIFGCSK